MNMKAFRFLIAAGVIGLASAVLAAGIDGLTYKKDMSAKLNSGKMLNFSVGEMNGKALAIVPMEDLNDLYYRAEGHSMANYN